MGEEQKSIYVKVYESFRVAAGTVSGGLAGLAAQAKGLPPSAAIALGAVTSELSKAGLDRIKDILERTLSQREEARATLAAVVAMRGIAERLQAGDELRPELPDGEAEEIFEGAIKIARDSYEEKKVRHLGRFPERFAFMPDLDPASAHRYLKHAEELSYRQYLLLSALSGRSSSVLPDKSFPTRIAGHVPGGVISPRHNAFYGELFDLTSLGFLGSHQRSMEPRKLRDMGLTKIGETIYELLGLDDIPCEDLADVMIDFEDLLR